MAIKVNGTTITDVKVNGTSVDTVKVNSTTVFTKTVTLQWQFVCLYSSEPDYYDFFTSQYINGDYEEGLRCLDRIFLEDLFEGFIAVIADLSTFDFFEFVVVAV